MSILFDLFGELVVTLAFVAIFAGWEYVAYRTSKRAWMWVAGLAGITLLIWFKGVGEVWSWMLGAGWLGVLAYCDYKLHMEVREAKAAEAEAAASERPFEGPRY